MRQKVVGWFFTVTGILACPCHLVITLPLAVALLSGTALGGWIATHEGAIAAGAGIYFVGALVAGFTLLSVRRASAAGASCALPAGLSMEDARHSVDRPRIESERLRPIADDSRDCCQPDQRLPGPRHGTPSRVTPGATSAGPTSTTPERADPSERAVSSGATTGRGA